MPATPPAWQFWTMQNNGETVSRLLPICSQTNSFERGRLSAAKKRGGQEFAHTNPFFHHAIAARVSTLPHYGSPLSITSIVFAILTIVDGPEHGKQAHATLHDGIL
jgi:hypothetical protein